MKSSEIKLDENICVCEIIIQPRTNDEKILKV